MEKNYPKNRRKAVAAELAKLSNTPEHRENVKRIEAMFLPKTKKRRKK